MIWIIFCGAKLEKNEARKCVVISDPGGGTFVTKWSYDAAGRPVWEKYPGGNASQVGEQVNYVYASQGLLDTVIGTATYIGDTQ